jgi:hypothetical protein
LQLHPTFQFEVEKKLSIVTKAKINLKEGTIDLEGSEAFVTAQLQIFAKEMKGLRFTPEIGTGKTGSSEAAETSEGRKRRRKGATPRLVAAIPLDLKAKDGKPDLKEFYKQKAPKSDMERVTLFAYYLKKYLNTDQIEAGHVVSCCKEVHCKIPADISQTFYNAQQHYAWLKAKEHGKLASITVQGDNLIETELPRKKDVTRSKTTT